MQEEKKKTKPWEFSSPLQLHHPKDILIITKQRRQWENSIGSSFHLREKRSCFFFGDEKDWINQARKANLSWYANAKESGRGVFRLSSGTAQQLGGGSRARSVNLQDAPLLVGVLEALGKSHFFFVFSFCSHLAPCMVWELRFLS